MKKFFDPRLDQLYSDMYKTIEQILEKGSAWIEDAFVTVDPETLEVKYIDGDNIIMDDISDGSKYGHLDQYHIDDFTEYSDDGHYVILEGELAATIKLQYDEDCDSCD